MSGYVPEIILLNETLPCWKLGTAYIVSLAKPATVDTVSATAVFRHEAGHFASGLTAHTFFPRLFL